MKKEIRTAALILGGLLFYNQAFAKSTALSINDIIQDLPIHPSKSYNQRSLNNISKVIIHHSATSSGSPYVYAQHHIEENDWPGIGYHFVIQKDGTIFQTNELTTLSYHATNCNSQGIGICLTGNFNVEHPNSEQINQLVSLIKYLNLTLSITLDIDPHHACKNTSCPGTHISIPDIQNRVYGNGIGDLPSLPSGD